MLRKKLLVRLVNKLYFRDWKKTSGNKIGSLLKTNATDNYSKPIRAKNVYKGKK